jgi:hypothetical protein
VGTFVEQAIVDYRLSIADQGKKNFCFLSPIAENKMEICSFLLPFAVFH